MKYPFFASFIILILIIRHNIRKGRNLSANSERNFWEKEREANATRKKSLEDIHYITVPLEELPTEYLPDDETVVDCIRILEELSQKKIVNLTGITNTDLKLKYGVANLAFLSECDSNYLLLVQTLQKWVNRLWDKGLEDAAIQIMEYEAKIHADVGSVYRRLANHYKNQGMEEKIHDLVLIVESLDSASKNAILRDLQQLLS